MRKRLSTSSWKNKYDIQNRSVLNKVGTPITCWTQLGIQAKSFESLARYLQVQRCVQLKSKMPAEISGHFIYYWRRPRDSNPRYRFKPICFLSREVPSTTRPGLHLRTGINPISTKSHIISFEQVLVNQTQLNLQIQWISA